MWERCGPKADNAVVLTQVGFAELKKTANNRANIGDTFIGVPIIGQ